MRTNDPVNRFCVNRLDDLGKMRRTNAKELRQLRSKKLLELFLFIETASTEIYAYRSL